MTYPRAAFVRQDGKRFPWDQAAVHVGAHGLHCGSSVSEGTRAHAIAAGPAAFCLGPHLERLFRSAGIGRLEIPFPQDAIRRAILDTISANEHRAGYIRPFVFRMAPAADVGHPAREEWLPRELLYMAGEMFFSGTAAEIAPIRSADGIPVGAGRRGPVTEQSQNEFFGIIEGRLPDRHGWLAPVDAGKSRRQS